jgi:hypothetical protein
MPVEGIEFTDITISADAGFEMVYAKGVRVSNTKIAPSKGRCSASTTART